MELAPICLFTYNRLLETQETIKALQNNYLANESDLIIFSDGYKGDNDKMEVMDVRVFINNIKGFKSVKVYESKTNKGLANSVIDSVSLVLENSKTVIVLEDDLLTTPNFLDFMNQSLNYYKTFNNIYAINGYSPDIGKVSFDLFKAKRAFPWGWATWKDRWDKDILSDNYISKNINKSVLKKFKNECGADVVNMLRDTLTGKNSSWYIRWVFINFLEKKVSIFPVKSKVMNIGFTDRGTHCSVISAYKSQLDKTFFREFNFIDLADIKLAVNSFLRYFSFSYKLLFRIKMLRSLHGFRLLFREFKNKIIL
jgi:hypothetical protein